MTTERPGESTEVTIDEASQSLMVERRRIYDIINILEAIEVVTRKGKNTYNWHGLSNITHTLRKLQQEALELFPDDVVQNQLDKLPKGHSTEPTGFDLLLASAEQVEKPLKRGKEKSLGRLSQKFIMLFLVGNETITLEEASDKILGKTDLPQAPPDATAEEMLKIRNANNKMIKTKIRRLYDIANIMASVGLIAKLHTENQAVGNAPRAKPMFKWIYPLTASEIMAQVDPTGDQQQQQQQQQQQPAEDALLAHHGAGDVQGAAKTGENDVVENPVALHQQHDQFSYPHQYPNDHHNHYHRNDQQEEQQHKQPYLRQTNTDSNVTYAETNHLVEEGVTNAMERNAALIANSVANNGDDCIHDMEAAAAAEAAVAAFEEGGNITGQNENYAGGDQERHEQVAMEESESIAV
jgi:E2F/DP family winged-helix DNA-binding domain.